MIEYISINYWRVYIQPIDEKRLNQLLQPGEEIKKREKQIRKMKDVRLRIWMKNNTYVARVARLLIESENILTDLDDYQVRHDQIYPDIEDFNLQVGAIRDDFIKYIDDNKELLLIDEKVDEYLGFEK